jgi:23S rRNA pseudouridine1911/1915/1917 synthase
MKKITITTEDAGMRLDKFLTREFFSMSRGEVNRQIKKGNVLVNKRIERPSYIIKESDFLEIGLIEPRKGLVANENVQAHILHILYEDENFIVLNKPAGVQVHPGVLKETNTLTNCLIAKYPEIADVHDDSLDSHLRPGIVHRLDKDTSGVMVIARNKESFTELKRLFHDRKIEKTYLALVCGKLDVKKGIIDKPIARSADYRKQIIAKKNTKTIVREAQTEYLVLGENENLSLVEVKPKTGRMHQIRVHFSSIGHPIAGDKLYGKDNGQKEVIKRQMLHAFCLVFEYKGERYEFVAPIPEDMLEVGSAIDEMAQMNYAKKAL